jgi:hypothetical protein
MSSETKYGIALIQFNEFSDPNLVVDFAMEAEKAGWDGIFLCDHLYYSREELNSISETWVQLSAIAAKTQKIKIGTYVSPLPRYLPWQLAKMTATLDILSKGRLILGVGLGGPAVEYEAFGGEYDTRILAEKMEESLVIIQGLWLGEPFSYSGKHYKIDNVCLLPKPLQTPRIPIIIGGEWPNKKPFIRAAKYDGAAPIHQKFPQELSVDDFKEIKSFIEQNRTSDEPFEILKTGTGYFAPDQRIKMINSYLDAGITWWLEHVNTLMQPSVEEMRKIVQQGPPKA